MIRNARALRRDATDLENRLWQTIRRRELDGVKFRRQHAIGKYVADFCAPAIGLVVEIDGSQHLDDHERDAARTRYLEVLGYRVIRFWDTDPFDGIVEEICRVAMELRREVSPSPAASRRPLPKGER